MPSNRLCLVNLSPATRAVALAAAHEILPTAERLEFTSIEAAEASEIGLGHELLVLGEPDALAVGRALAARDSSGLPRWAVVILGRERAESAETVAPDEWHAPLLARVFRSALREHALRCENLRLRGDLKTVARRISHDLRSPVGCVHTSSDVLMELSAGDIETVLSMAEMIKQSSGEISQIVDRVSFVLWASANPTAPAKVDMAEVITTVLHQLEEDLEKTRASVSQPPTWPEVHGVAPWLQVIWSNLLGNALRHTGSTPQVRISWNLDRGDYRFSVADRGAGVVPTREAGLFSRFDQLHGIRTHGLGLSIVQRLVALQGGRCGYEKLPEGGASFYFTLPSAG